MLLMYMSLLHESNRCTQDPRVIEVHWLHSWETLKFVPVAACKFCPNLPFFLFLGGENRRCNRTSLLPVGGTRDQLVRPLLALIQCSGEPSNRLILRRAASSGKQTRQLRPDVHPTLLLRFFENADKFPQGAPTFQDRGTRADLSRARGHEAMHRAHERMVSMRFLYRWAC